MHPRYTRRRFVASAVLAVATGAAATLRFDPARATPRMLVSAERTGGLSTRAHALILGGPRVERLQIMAGTLSALSGMVILRLDPVDDHLLDVAAQQAGASVRRGAAAPGGLGVVAHVTPLQRSFA